MQRFVSTVLAAVFFIWILPLGVFIAPSKEKIACDGQRAICLCSSKMSVAKKGVESGIKIKSASAAQKEQSGSGGASHYFTAGQTPVGNALVSSRLFDRQSLSYTNPILSSLDHVPKA